jgi:FtsZ-binding cell division protein ZapB
MVAERNQMILNLNVIRIDGGTQSRDILDQDAINTYAENMAAGDKFPEVTVYFNGLEYYLADGFHRYFAHKKLGKASIGSNVVTGTLRDAILFSKGANADNGLHRSNATKRKVVNDMLDDFEWHEWNAAEIAKACRVSDEFVRKVKAERNIKPDTVKYKMGQKTFERKATSDSINSKAEALTPKEEVEFKYDPQAELLESLAAENEQLKDKLAVNQMVGTAEEKSQATGKIAELRERIRVLEAELEAIKVTRNSYQTENGQLKKQVAMLQKKLKAAGL